MNRIKFNSETKVFGILSDRVRKSTLGTYKSKYGENSDKYKDRLERDSLLDEIESHGLVLKEDGKPDELDMYRPYGYASSTPRTLDTVINTSGRLPKGYGKSSALHSSTSRYRLSNLGNKAAINVINSKYLNNLWDEYTKSAKSHLKKEDNKRVVTPKVLNKIKELGALVAELPTDSGLLQFKTESGDIVPIVNINPNDSDYTASHELQHRINERRGLVSKSRKKSKSEFDDKTEFMNSIPDSNKLLNYVRNVLDEELSANRGTVMNTYLHGGDSVTDTELDEAYIDALNSQGSHDSIIGGCSPNSIRYEMSPEDIDKLKRNMKAS